MLWNIPSKIEVEYKINEYLSDYTPNPYEETEWTIAKKIILFQRMFPEKNLVEILKEYNLFEIWYSKEFKDETLRIINEDKLTLEEEIEQEKIDILKHVLKLLGANPNTFQNYL